MMGILTVVSLYLLWSSSFPIGKWLLGFSSPVFLTGIRMFFAGSLITLFLILRQKGLPSFNAKQWISLLLLGLLSIYLSNIFEFYGLRSLSAGKTCFIYSLSPFLSALLSYIHFKEKMNLSKWVGLIIGFAGVIWSLDFSGGLFSQVALPELAVLMAVLTSVYGWILMRMVVKDQQMSPLTVNGWSMLFGGSMALIHSFLIDSWSPLPVAIDRLPRVIGGVAMMTLISNLICYNLYGILLKRFTATFLSFFGLLSPFFAAFNAWILLNELPSVNLLISTPIVVSGLWLFYRSELRQGYIIKKAS